MSYVATLIANPKKPCLDDPIINAARDALLRPAPPQWLGSGVAADIPFAKADASIKDIHARLREALGSQPVDSVVQQEQARRKSLFLADMDSTMIEQECIDELADFVGKKAFVADITERAMRGEIDFEPALRERVALLKGLPVEIIDQVIKERITLTPGGRELVRTMKANKAHTCLVSGGFTLFTQKVAQHIGFDENRANILLSANGRLTGEVAEPILGKQAKLDALQDLRKKHALDKHQTLAVGDGANDLAMLEESGLGVAFRAKPKVAEAAHARIDHGDLTALLYMQGYRQKEFIAEPF